MCGVDFCDSCGDCLACYGSDPCLSNDDGEHVWLRYDGSEAGPHDLPVSDATGPITFREAMDRFGGRLLASSRQGHVAAQIPAASAAARLAQREEYAVHLRLMSGGG